MAFYLFIAGILFVLASIMTMIFEQDLSKMTLFIIFAVIEFILCKKNIKDDRKEKKGHEKKIR